MNTTNRKILIIVESPAKCKTILSYLNSKDITILASYGHIRSLPKKQGSVLPNENFKMIWQDNENSGKHIKQIIDAAKKLKDKGLVLLATDPDREGSGIAQHIYQLLLDNQINCEIKRIIFNEITKKAVNQAIQNPLDIDTNQVDAYFARLAVDYLIGFSLSPLLWKKVKGCKSAGRVQSATLRAVVEREMDITVFKPQEYWTIKANFELNKNTYEAELFEWQGKAIEKFMWNKDSVQNACEVLKTDHYDIDKIEIKNTKQTPNAPFITSTLQQEASSKLGWKPSKTSKIAQTLYEGVNIGTKTIGLITYIRTDSFRMSDQAMLECSEFIQKEFGNQYFAKRVFKNKSEVAQDAHEAIRPTDFNLTPDMLNIDSDLLKLYKLIWVRAVASQMSEAQFKLINIFIKGNNAVWKIHDRIQEFDGFLKLFERDEISPAIHELFKCTKTTKPVFNEIIEEKHETQPKPRFTEAGLIKHMDEVGIGRPSTYSSTLDVLQDRGYISVQNKKIMPSPSAFLVIGFLNNFCNQYIQDDFTSKVEEDLDLIAQGNVQWRSFLNQFWSEFDKLIGSVSSVKIPEIKEKIELQYGEYFFQKNTTCPLCEIGKKTLCNTTDGVFIGCSNHPNCKYIGSVSPHPESTQTIENILGRDTETKERILMKNGKYGEYLHWEDSKRNITISNIDKKNITLDFAMLLKKFPLELGKHPYTNLPISLGFGKYGPYVLYNSVYISCRVPIEEITLDKAINILSASKKITNKEVK